MAEEKKTEVLLATTPPDLQPAAQQTPRSRTIAEWSVVAGICGLLLNTFLAEKKGSDTFVQGVISGKLDNIASAISTASATQNQSAIQSTVALTKAADAMDGMTGSLSELEGKLGGLVKVQTKQVEQAQIDANAPPK
jgi:hypothetical protein